jgi:hypothetical protein
MMSKTRTSIFGDDDAEVLDVTGFAPKSKTDDKAPRAEQVRAVSQAANFRSREPTTAKAAPKETKRIPRQDYGMATIWDADILIWAASVLCDMKNRGTNDIPRELKFQPHDLLKAISRGTGGKDYVQLKDSMERLKATVVTTNIRAKRGHKTTMFSLIDQWDDLVDAQTKESRGMTLTVSDTAAHGRAHRMAEGRSRASQAASAAHHCGLYCCLSGDPPFSGWQRPLKPHSDDAALAAGGLRLCALQLSGERDRE